MKKLFLLLFLPKFCFSLEEKPWFGNCLEFHFRPEYEYNFFRKIDHASPQLRKNYQTHVLNLGLDLTIPEDWNWEAEVEWATTSSVSFKYRSFAFQVRKLWLDDVCGDCVSLSTGLVYRDASDTLRKAFSTPYHARANFELHAALGKEWSRGCDWIFRMDGVFAVGQGTQGSPWLRGDATFWFNIQECHQFRFDARSYFGLGDRETVHTRHFKGWSHIRHQSIDLGVGYLCYFGCWGSFEFDYLYRVYARSYPEHVNFFIFTLDLPFSIF